MLPAPAVDRASAASAASTVSSRSEAVELSHDERVVEGASDTTTKSASPDVMPVVALKRCERIGAVELPLSR
jgi:hypothetical protein